jgi:hypothetical protein
MDKMNANISLRNVEAGYAEVLNANGRRIGTVSSEKSGSTRTGVTWYAYRGKTRVGYGYTRAEAIAALVADVEKTEAARANFIRTN